MPTIVPPCSFNSDAQPNRTMTSVFILKSKRYFPGHHILVLAVGSAQLFPTVEHVLGLQQKIRAEPVAQSQSQAPQIFRKCVQRIFFRVSVSNDGKAVRRDDLAPTRRGVDLRGELLNS